MTDHAHTYYHFVVVCPDARAVFLTGDFNDWSTTATPMARTDDNVWQISIVRPDAAPGPRARFGYVVVDRAYRTGHAAFGAAFPYPGSWATAVEDRVVAATRVAEPLPA